MAGFGGLVAQSALVGRAVPNLTARQLIDTDLLSATRQTPLADPIALLAGGGQQAISILEGSTLVGLFTRSDLIALLSGHLPA